VTARGPSDPVGERQRRFATGGIAAGRHEAEHGVLRLVVSGTTALALCRFTSIALRRD
jgi:hypothetical protein